MQTFATWTFSTLGSNAHRGSILWRRLRADRRLPVTAHLLYVHNSTRVDPTITCYSVHCGHHDDDALPSERRSGRRIQPPSQVQAALAGSWGALRSYPPGGLAAVGRQLSALSFSVPPPPGPRGKGRRPALGERGGGARRRTAVAAHAAAAGCYGAAPCHLLSARPGLAPGRPAARLGRRGPRPQ